MGLRARAHLPRADQRLLFTRLYSAIDLLVETGDEGVLQQKSESVSSSSTSAMDLRSPNLKRDFSEVMLFKRRLCRGGLLQWKYPIDVHFEWTILDEAI